MTDALTEQRPAQRGPDGESGARTDQPRSTGAIETLADQLRAHLGEALGAPVDVADLRRITGGASHETWSVDAVDGDRVVEQLVVRRDVEHGLLDSDGDTEFRLLSALHGAGLPVPRAWVRVEEDGRPALTIIQRVAGADARKLLARSGSVATAAAVRRDAAAAQAAIHRADWRTALRGVLDAPAGSPATAEVEHWAATLDGCAPSPQPLLRAAVSWLRANPPRPVEPALVHGDFKANNLLVDQDGGVTVLDWELAHVGDPVEDLAWTAIWNTDADLIADDAGRDAYLAAYADAGGAPVDPGALRFWEVLALVKLAGIFLTGVRPGATNLPTLAQLGRAVPYVEHRLAALLGSALRDGAA